MEGWPTPIAPRPPSSSTSTRLIHTGGSGARSWAMAFRDLHDVEADIGEHSSAGETDPQAAPRRSAP